MSVLNLHPEQAQQLLLQSKGEHQALSRIIPLKRQALALLDQMDEALASNSLSSALSCFVEIQRLEYTLTVDGLEEKLKQVSSIIQQLESPIVRASPMRIGKG